MAETPATRPSLLVRLRDPLDAVAWGEFVHLYAPLVYGYARRCGLQDADAADLSQEVLVSVAGAIGRLEYDPQRGAFRGWLLTIVRRKLLDWRRRRELPRGEADLDLVADPGGPEAAWELEWERAAFAWACAQVRPTVSAPTWRTAVDGLTCQQAAAELGLSLAAVYCARSRVLSRLRELVQSAEDYGR